jgi:hypothetical protein
MIYLKTFWFWTVLLLVAVACGILREFWLVPALGLQAARVIGSLVVCVLFFGLIYRYIGKFVSPSQGFLVKLGLFWMTLAILFEFLFGRYVMGHSWQALGADYNVFEGRLWPLVLLVIWFGPLLAGQLRGYLRGQRSA